MWILVTVLIALISFVLFLYTYSYRRMRLGERIVNDVVKEYLLGKKNGLAIDEIEQKLAAKNGIELLEPYSHHLDRETIVFRMLPTPQTEVLKELLVLQRIAFDISCAKGLYDRPRGKQLTPVEHEHMRFVGSRVEARLREWGGMDE